MVYTHNNQLSKCLVCKNINETKTICVKKRSTSSTMEASQPSEPVKLSDDSLKHKAPGMNLPKNSHDLSNNSSADNKPKKFSFLHNSSISQKPQMKQSSTTALGADFVPFSFLSSISSLNTTKTHTNTPNLLEIEKINKLNKKRKEAPR